jgi:hypothetical protein
MIMNPLFITPIKSEADAEGFFFCLNQQGVLFHPEDDPVIVINDQGQLFSDDEVRALRQRINEVYEFMDDPCEYILSMTDPDFKR